MKALKIILILFVVVSAGYLIAKEFAGKENKQTNVALESQSVKHPDGIVVYYFHGNRRCPTCKAIEKYSQEATAQYINDKQITWSTINVDDSRNKHFINDFNLSSSGPVIVEYKDNKIMHWKAFDRVWQLVRNKDAFIKYIDDEIKRFVQ